MLALTALVTAALFTGAALYISWAEHPARMALDDAAALDQWRRSYGRAAPLQALLALISAATAFAAWWRWRSNWFWFDAGVAMIAVVGFTLLVIFRTNAALKRADGSDVKPLLLRWGRLHWVRTALGLLATALIWYGLKPD